MSPNNEWHREDDDDLDADFDEANYKSQKDAIIIAIDVSSSMLAPPDPPTKNDKDSLLLTTLKCVAHLMKQRIISKPKDLMGILFFGTAKSKSFDDSRGIFNQTYPNCYVFVDLDILMAEDIRALKNLIEEDEEGILEPGTKATMANVLFCANQIFTAKAANILSRRLFIITDNDDPHPDDKQAKAMAVTRAKDLYYLNVRISLFPVIKKDTKFNAEKFYNDIIYRNADDDVGSEVLTSTSGLSRPLLKNLISNITSKQVAKRALFSNLAFKITPELTISVSGYNIIQEQKPTRSCYIYVDEKKAYFVKSETAILTADTAETVQESDKKKAFKFGGTYVVFTNEELKELRDFKEPVIRILGFKPKSLTKLCEGIKRATFIYPSEGQFEGSTRVFISLWKKLLKDDKVGVAWCIIRSNSRPTLSLLVPTAEKTNEKTGIPYLPAGIWLYPIPFAEDIRYGPDEYLKVKPSSKLVDNMAEVIENLWLPGRRYDPTRFPNPALQWHYRILQALALAEEMPETPIDATIPKYEAIRNRVGNTIKEINKMINAESDEINKKTGKVGAKRELGADDEAPVKKKKADELLRIDDKQLLGAVEDNSVYKMTVPQLKDMLVIRGIAANGKKADLIDRLSKYLEKQL